MRRLIFFRKILSILVLPTFVLGLYTAFILAPAERTMGIVQRIFYFHLPLAWIAFLAFFVVFLGGVLYLIRGSIHWDILAQSSAEIGLLFSTLVLLTGSIWARQVWNTWWTWDPRLTTMLILWFIYLGYLMVRGAVQEVEKRARVSAVIGIVGFVDVPIVFLSILWWRTMHPLIITQERMGLTPEMLTALMVNLFAFTLFYTYLLLQRVGLGLSENALEELGEEINENRKE